MKRYLLVALLVVGAPLLAEDDGVPPMPGCFTGMWTLAEFAAERAAHAVQNGVQEFSLQASASARVTLRNLAEALVEADAEGDTSAGEGLSAEEAATLQSELAAAQSEIAAWRTEYGQDQEARAAREATALRRRRRSSGTGDPGDRNY